MRSLNVIGSPLRIYVARNVLHRSVLGHCRCLNITSRELSTSSTSRLLSEYNDRPKDRTKIPDFIREYSSKLTAGERNSHLPIHILCGRIISPIRELSHNLVFFHIESDNEKLQVLAD